ncbi:MAG: hypothetical protein EBV31_02515 [Verrucomicrobia bacterium]|nr:hypothetical protein [Verrucomicrobiota bacterium]
MRAAKPSSSAGQRAFADEGVVAMGGEELGERLVGVGQVGGGKADREVGENEDLRLVLDRAELGEHLGGRDADGGGADLGVGVLEGEADVFGAGGGESVKGPERVEPRGGGGLRVGQQRAQGGGGLEVAGFDEQALGRVAHPAVGVVQELHAFGGKARDLRRARRRLVVADDAPDAAAADGQLEVARLDVGDEVVREEGRVLEHAAVEVDDVQRAIGSVGHHDRAEALVGGRQELFFFIGIGAREHAVLLRDRDALHQVGRRLRDERVAAELGGEGVAAVDGGAAGGGRRGKGAVGAEGLGVVTAVHARGRMGRVDGLVLDHLVVDPDRVTEERIARVSGGRQEVGAEEVGVVVVEQAAGVVLGEAPLPAAEAGAFLPGAVGQLEARAVVRGVDAVVHRPRRRVGHVFGLTAEGAEVGGDEGLLVGDAGAFRVAAEEEVGWFGDEGAAFDGHHPARHHQVVEEGRSLVHAAVAVGVGEQRDAAGGLLLGRAFEVAHVAAHLDDEHPTLVVEADGDRRFDHRLAGDEFDAEAGRELEGLEFLLGGQRSGGGQVELQGDFGRSGVALVQGEGGRSSDEQS